ncbi:prevent-host-death protein [Mucilaginibacter sp. CAU 1740]|uniref:type II toxin-antitoxin system Phd/YefM family antitoxin n=1 Tax=Mucilaginibacter sp. CAU 1740 TaxID=3140365 RepID=UPI00325BF8B8
MKTITDQEFKTNFAEVISQIKAGESFAINSYENKEVIGYLLPKETPQKAKRQLGLLEGKVKIEFKPDFKMTDEELCGLPPKV